ncbi:MAG: HAMP domain-containing histidine kinase [Oscillospiraceae bacterium]|nr:HAMP domain-containing histidine kinase [Oscillospiraceae bacterium]
MLYLIGLCVILFAAVIILAFKIYLMKKSAKEISEGFAEKLQTDTNTLIDISSSDREMRALADSINKQLIILRKGHHRYMQGDKELKTAITNISHDLRTPLTTICGYLDIMKRMEKPPKIAEYLDIIDERAELMEQLTEELFRYSVILSEESAGESEEVFVNQVLAESVSGYYAVLTKQGITPNIRITENRIVRKLNKTSLSRVFSNLLNNAVKYSDGDLAITLSDTGEITFANTAKALSSVEVERLFDRFYTVETARNSTGLGLSIVRTLAEQMGGNISAEYKDNTLYIRLVFSEKPVP